jgi:hypothetical protein
MSYVKYDHDIVDKYKVELLGWPTSIKFANPSEIGTVDKIQRLCQVLKVSECKWVIQLHWQQAIYAENLAAKEAAGETVVKKREERSDKGKVQMKKTSVGELRKAIRKHARHDEDDTAGQGEGNENEEEPPKNKHKRAPHSTAAAARKVPPAAKSKEFIVDSDESDGEVD